MSENTRYPLSYPQESFWLNDQLFGRDTLRHLSLWTRLRVTGDLDEDALRNALHDLVRRHAPLRTTLAEGNPVQQLVRPPTLAERTVTFSTEPSAAVGRTSGDAVDCYSGPLAAAWLTPDDQDGATLTLQVAHYACDPESFPVIRRDLAWFYAVNAGQETRGPLPALEAEYGPFAATTRAEIKTMRADPANAAMAKYQQRWKTRADAVVPLKLTGSRDAAPELDFAGRAIRFDDAELFSIRQFCRKAGATTYTAAAAALFAVLSMRGEAEVIPLLSVRSTRHQPWMQHLVGLFIEPMVLLGDLRDSPSFNDLARSVRSDLAAELHEGGMPLLELMVDFPHLAQLLADYRLHTNVLFQYFGPPSDQTRQSAPAVPAAARRAKSPVRFRAAEVRGMNQQVSELALNLYEHPDSLELHVSFDQSLWDVSDIDRICVEFTQALVAGCRDPGISIDRLGRAARDEKLGTARVTDCPILP